MQRCSAVLFLAFFIPVLHVVNEKIHITPESETYSKHSSALLEAMKDPAWLASELCSENLITSKAYDDILASVHKTKSLLDHFKTVVAEHPEHFQPFLAVLKKQRSLHWLVNRMEATYSKFAKYTFYSMSCN